MMMIMMMYINQTCVCNVLALAPEGLTGRFYPPTPILITAPKGLPPIPGVIGWLYRVRGVLNWVWGWDFGHEKFKKLGLLLSPASVF